MLLYDEYFACREIATALVRRNHDFWFGLVRNNQTWTYYNGQMPSYREIHWAVTSMVNAASVNGVMVNVDVAGFRSIEGDSNDLLTYAANPTSWAWALCEYNCQ